MILYLEDGFSLRESTADWLRELGYDVVDFGRIDLADEFLGDHLDEVICVIADLNMNDEWLDEYQSESEGAILSGWVWLKRFVYPKKQDMPTVIYSKFSSFLKEYLHSKNKLSELRGGRRIKLVSKGFDANEGVKALEKALNELGIRP